MPEYDKFLSENAARDQHSMKSQKSQERLTSKMQQSKAYNNSKKKLLSFVDNKKICAQSSSRRTLHSAAPLNHDLLGPGTIEPTATVSVVESNNDSVKRKPSFDSQEHDPYQTQKQLSNAVKVAKISLVDQEYFAASHKPNEP